MPPVVRRLAIVVWIGLVAVASQASADETQTATLELTIEERLEGCPTEAVIRRTVAAHLGWDPFRDVADLHVVARLSSDGEGLVATVRAFEADGAPVGEREFRSETADCEEVARAMALAISVAVDPFVLTRVGPDAPTLVEAPDEVASPPVAEEPARALPPPRAPQAPPAAPPAPTSTPPLVRFRTGCALGAGVGVVPSVRPFAACGAGLRLRRFELDVALRYDAPAKAGGPSGGSVVASSLGPRIEACFVRSLLVACGRASSDWLLARGEGVDVPRRSAAIVSRVGASVGVEWSRGAFAVRPFAAADVALVRPELTVNYETAFAVPVASGTLGASVLWSSP